MYCELPEYRVLDEMGCCPMATSRHPGRDFCLKHPPRLAWSMSTAISRNPRLRELVTWRKRNLTSMGVGKRDESLEFTRV